MAKLCYRVNGTVKKYDLKDSANTPRLAVKINGSTKYLPLKEGAANSKEISIKNRGSVYHIQSLPVISSMWKFEYTDKPGGVAAVSRMGVFPVCDDNNKILAAIFVGWEVIYSKIQAVTVDAVIPLDSTSTSYSSTYLTKPSGITFNKGTYSTVLVKIAHRSMLWGTAGDTDVRVNNIDTVGPAANILTGATSAPNEQSDWQIHDDTITASNYNTTYSGSSAYTYRSNWSRTIGGSGHAIDSYSTVVGVDPNLSTGVGKQLPYFYASNACWDNRCKGINWSMYVEFPENGLTDIKPSDIINEWASTLGSNYRMFTSY